MSHPDPQPVSALILAGARKSGDALADAHGVASKAVIEIAGKTMLGRVLGVLRDALPGGQLTVVGLPESGAVAQREGWPEVDIRPGADGPAASVAGALSSGGAAVPVLVTTCDHVLLSAEMVTHFVHASQAADADLTVALARREVIEAAYPDVARTYLRLGGEDYSACNLFFLNTPKAVEVVKFWQQAEADRKRPWRIAWRFGVVSALRILVGRAPLDKTFAIASRRLGVRARPVLMPFADAAVDVDKPSDLALVTRVLEARAA